MNRFRSSSWLLPPHRRSFAASAFAQDIKLGYNGDLSASPSAQSGQAAVLGMQAAIDDINAAGGVLGRKLTLVVRDDISAAAEVDPEHERPDRQREGRGRVRPDELGQRHGLEAHPEPEEDPGHRQCRLGNRHHQADEPGRGQLHVPRFDGRPRTGRRADRLCEEERGIDQGRGPDGRDHRLRPGRPEGHAGDRRRCKESSRPRSSASASATPT